MSADGSTIATTRGNPNEGQMLILYDTLTSNATTMMPMPGVNNIGDVALNADGSRVAVAYETVTAASSVTAVDLIDPAANSRTTLPHNSAVTTLAFSPDGGVLATYAMQTDQILVWSMRDNSVISTWDSDVSGALDATPSIPPIPPAMAFNPGSTTLAIGGRLGTVEVWSLIGQNRLSSFEVYQEGSGAVQALAFSPDNNVLLAAGGAFDHGPNRPEEPLMIFNLTNGQVMQTAFTPVDVTTGMAFSPNGIRLFTLTGFDYLLMYGVQ
jgi:WD40 repeat protein